MVYSLSPQALLKATLSRRQVRRQRLFGPALWIIGFLLFSVYPIISSFYYSLCDYSVLSKPVFIGAQNYRDLATDELFWKALYNTFYFAAFSIPKTEPPEAPKAER